MFRGPSWLVSAKKSPIPSLANMLGSNASAGDIRISCNGYIFIEVLKKHVIELY
jgi:exosome complex RNA-binding protein Rrp4